MSEQLDRPARPARGPRPAPDAGVDPIDYRTPSTPKAAPTVGETPAQRPVSAPVVPPQAKAPAVPRTTAAPSIGPAVREQTVQLNSRVSADVAAIFDAAAAGFPSKRAALEHAITEAFGS